MYIAYSVNHFRTFAVGCNTPYALSEVMNMAVSKKNTRIFVTVSKRTREQIERSARSEGQTLSGLCGRVLTVHFAHQKGGAGAK